jgi:hypothetical protein
MIHKLHTKEKVVVDVDKKRVPLLQHEDILLSMFEMQHEGLDDVEYRAVLVGFSSQVVSYRTTIYCKGTSTSFNVVK